MTSMMKTVSIINCWSNGFGKEKITREKSKDQKENIYRLLA